MTDRKSELATMCRLEIRRTVTLAQISMADYGYHLVMPVFDVEFQAMIDRLDDAPFTEHDIPALQEIVMEELWPRLRKSHAKQRDAAFDKLIADYPEIVVHYANFAFDIGWIPLVRDACERMRTYPRAWKIRLDCGKEKFGYLDLFVSCVVAERGAMAEVKRLREEIRLRSLATCDICGGSGRLRLGGYAKTVCDKHSAIFEGFHEDDGLWADPWRWRGTTDVPLRVTALGKQIDDDTWQRRGREQELLIEFGAAIEDVVNGAVVKTEYLDDYIAKELDGWRTTAFVPLPERDRKFLHGYLCELIDAEYERVKGK
ncbi:hypothetical protein ACQKGC_23805 [Allorhizobium pseudoryzae]|uniref:hypothetical protein n=1 Tax=Allorhizobium pseudoryzae TaxID=379684 RepID=UPI003D06784B